MNRITKGAPSRMLKDCPDVLNIDEMCAALGICTRIGDRLQRDGSIVSRKVGRKYCIPEPHLPAYLKMNSSVGAGSDAPPERHSPPALRIPPIGNATPKGGVWRKRWDSNPRTHLWITRFRVEAVMTTSIRFHSLFIIKHFHGKSQGNPPRTLDLTFGNSYVFTHFLNKSHKLSQK